MKMAAVVFLIALMLLAAPISATSVRLVNLPQMVRLADRVFAGKCLDAEPLARHTANFPVTRYRFQVLRNLKGTVAGEQITFLQARLSSGASGKPGMPEFREGEEVLLFLHGDSALGLTSPVGMAQGVFEVHQTPEGEVGLVNRLDNFNLGFEWTGPEALEAGVTQADLQSLKRGVPIPIETLARLVERIDGHHTSGGGASK